jgi:hypothetical protein
MFKQKNRGVNVMSHRFNGSGHVNHFRMYPEEYSKLILNFIVNIQNNNLTDL